MVNAIKGKKGNLGLMAVKIDMNEAYDRLEWKFIEAVFKAHGFDQAVVDLIMFGIKSVSF